MRPSLFDILKKDPTITTASCMALETAANKALEYDPATKQKLDRIEGLWIHIETHKPRLQLFFSVRDRHFVFRPLIDETPESQTTELPQSEIDAKISGDLIDFVRLSDKQYSLSHSSLHVSGKSGLLTELQNIFSGLDIDWEQALSALIGIVPGHLVAESIRKITRQLNETRQSVEFHLSDYLSEELRSIPSNTELDIFYQGVDDVNAQVNRLEARINQLRSTSKPNS